MPLFFSQAILDTYKKLGGIYFGEQDDIQMLLVPRTKKQDNPLLLMFGCE